MNDDEKKEWTLANLRVARVQLDQTIRAVTNDDDTETFFSSIIARVEKAKAIWEEGR